MDVCVVCTRKKRRLQGMKTKKFEHIALGL
jgi:hypothetical protein